MITFDFDNVHLDDGRPRDPIDILLRVVARMTVRIDENELISEEEFPIVELAAQLDHWLKHDAEDEFKYDSAAAEDTLLWFKPEAAGWRVGSDWQKQPIDQRFPMQELRGSVRSYVGRVKTEVKRTLNIDITPALRLHR